MTTFTQKCELTGTEKTFDVISQGFCVSHFTNAAGREIVNLYRIISQTKLEKIHNFVAQRDANDIEEIKEQLIFNGVKEDLSTEINNYLVSKL